MTELGQQTVEFSSVVRRAAEESFLGLKELVEESKLSDHKNSDKRHDLLKYIVGTRQRMLRLLILAKWCQQVPLVQYCQQLAATLSSHDTCFTQAADSLFFMHEGLQQARAPIYDVPSAIEVLLTGSYQRLPKCIEDMGIHGVLSEAEQGPALKKLDTLLRSRLLEVSLPKEISGITVSDGAAQLQVDGEFKVLLTLGYRGHLTMWRILHLELLVGEKSGRIKLEEMRRHVLGDDLERRMAASDNPFSILYSILHELCVSLIMDTVIRQVQALRQGRWKDVIRFELISDVNVSQAGNPGSMQLGQDVDSDSTGPKTPGLKITYWLDTDKNVGGSDLGSPPCIKIEPGQDLQIKCIHDSFVIDPLTGKEVEFSLNQSCIDVEKLLLRAIACNKHTCLLEIYKELLKNSQIYQAPGDVVLQCEGNELDVDLKKKVNFTSTEEYGVDGVLLVRAYGSLYIILGINIRSGRFLLQSSRNIISRSTLSDCEEALNQGSISAAEVFINLRTKSILHLFASIGRFLGLKVYEQGLAAVRIPKSILNGSDLLLMGFPQCGSSYYLLMQLDKDFKPHFKLLETQPDPSGRSTSVGDSTFVIRYNKIDVSQMQMVEDELNLSLLDWEKLLSFLPNYGGPSRTLEHSLVSEFGQEASLQMPGYPQSSFSSVVDKVFELEKGVLAPSFPTQNHLSSSFNTSPHSHLSSVSMNPQIMKGGLTSIKWDGVSQLPHSNNITKVSSAGPSLNSSQYPSSNIKGLLQSGAVNSFSSSPVRSPSIQRLRPSKSDQELTSHKSPPHSFEVGSRAALDEDQLRLLKESTKEMTTKISGSRPVRMPSPLRTGSRVAVPGMKQNLLRSPPTGNMVGSLKASGASSWTTSPVCTAPESSVSNSPTSDIVPKHEKDLRKHSIYDFLKHIPSLRGVAASTEVRKRRKISDSVNSLPSASESSLLSGKTEGYTYGSVLAEANHGRAPSSIYFTTFLHVVRHCSLCIKHARLTSQMDALDIPYVEEVGLRIPSSNLWFRLPFARDDSWQHICLRLGRPGSMCWDVKVNDQHFRDLWELQKDSSTTVWGCGVRIANTSDADSHIRYNSEGVVLSYKTVEDDSIQKLVADLRRLSNARSFAIGIRKLLGVRAEDKLEDGANSEIKTGSKVGTEVLDKTSDQLRRAFRIEAVGLMSLWFSFGSMSAVMARFVVEWEAGKEGCTMHVSPDQLWPHTKFLEDFINGAEVASLLDCIRLTTGPLLALAGAIRPARMTGPASPGIHGASVGPSPALKQNGFVPPSQVVSPNSSTSITNPPAAAPVGNSVAGSVMGSLGNHSLQSVAMLSVAGRGGPGIVPSSLLPIDISVVLRGPYWIRIIYRKNFAVDMRCFAGDQVWLQPATPAKREPEGGGSLPCPQFRPFIMEHVAQGLNALEQPNFTIGTPNVGAVNSSSINATSNPQSSMPNGNRLNLTNSGGIARPTSMVGNQGTNLSRVTGAMLASSGLATVGSGLPIRPPQGASVPVHVRGDLNTAFIGLGDDGGYGGGFVPLAALKKVLRGILKYLGVLWLFAQLPGLLKEILSSILKENEGALLNLDQEQPALRFFVGGYVFAVSVHRVQLLLQVLSVKRFHQQQQQQNQNNAQDELAPAEISEICDYFSRRVASEPYDASRVASFITLLTLPISVLREFLRLIAWKKGLSQAQAGDMAPAQRPRIELCLENHTGYSMDESSDNPHTSKSNIHYDRARNAVDFGLTFVLDPAHIPHINAAGGAAWLPYCVSVRLRYSFGESTHISLIGMEGSHGGRACWSRVEDWEKCKHRVRRVVEHGTGNAFGESSQGRLRTVADALQRTLQMLLQQLRDSSVAPATNGA